MSGFLLDTNVISELLKPRPEPRVTSWVETVIDGLLAATALHHNLTFVTRDTSGITNTGVAFFNPWQS